MRERLLFTIGFAMIVAGLSLILWPVPLFTLNEPYLTWYVENVLMIDNTPGGAGAALPFVWLFMSAPAGAILAGAGIIPLHLSRRP